jgi:DNA-binding HxlR family transcriptional regulator
MEPTLTNGHARFVQLAYGLRHLLNGEWIADVLIALNGEPLRYHRLLSAINASCTHDTWAEVPRQAQEWQLTRTLFRMEGSGLVVRRDDVDDGIRVVLFALTPAAEQLVSRCGPLVTWAEEHVDLVEHHQRARAQNRDRPKPGPRAGTARGEAGVAPPAGGP